ncbi:hypothetical protein TNIN_383451 [Trichonephila inaurata madagascariensis]|uniref:Uncharacterized protein n=1 Tax=Trichonephila inaurata madagascariensis TaxID=2747483 RepID=A0A8X7CB89_9ARAC|nr:hypothetical protein TNIN_383451 [Trichonephila inaurata madagascariensis]
MTIEKSAYLSKPSVPRKTSEAFDFKKLCLFWDQVADEAAETKKKEKNRCKISVKDPEEEGLRIVEAAAAIIREDIWSSVVETTSYPAPTSYGKTVQYEISIAYHPQPRILSSESRALVRYVGDNADINVHTLDGNNTLHVMGMNRIVTPKDVY